MIAQALLKQAGIDSITASDGREALELFDKNSSRIDIILMDLHMPVMNGYEASQEIRKKSVKIPIVAMTADVIMGVREKCEQSGIYHYISKPFDPDHFIKTVKEILLSSEEEADDSAALDKALGLKNMGGNGELYRKVLLEYYNENRDTQDRLLAALNQKDYPEAVKIVHKVKSSSGSIGGTEVYLTAQLLQKALTEQNEEEIQLLQEKFIKKLYKLLTEIENL